ncbi:nose resistant to fluoxetine protein 6-like [Oratosquilla oratoria]|uniref:nose resistant to fluoxetine protein 6-like n=1 Tax=Oratosquilla oratoria TaxID=337810 RepID=UPI003F772E73
MKTFLWTISLVCLLLGDHEVQSNPAEDINEWDDPDLDDQTDFIGHRFSPFRRPWGSFFRNQTGGAFGPWPGMYLPFPGGANISAQCKKDILFTLQNPNLAVQMVDSWGKFPDGILMGNLNVDGSYSQCLSLKYEDQKHSISGKYCSAVYLRSVPIGSSGSVRTRDKILTDFRLGQLSAAGSVYPPLGYLIYGTCMPSSCTSNDLKMTMEDTLTGNNLIVGVYCTTDETENQYQFLPGDIAFIVVVSILFTLVVVAAIVDIFIDMTGNQDIRKGPLKYLLVFSLSTNIKKLFHVSEKGARGSIDCIHGIRLLSMTWVLWGHQYAMNFSVYSNIMSFGSKTTGLFFQIIENATVSVDSFFFLSGLLVSYGVMRELQRTGRLNVIKLYVHRLVRLTPPIAIAVGYMATIARFFPKGPRAWMMEFRNEICHDNWWKDILYVNNYITFHEDNKMLDCLPQSWYLAVDTQLFLVAPLLLLPLHFYPRIGQGFLYVFSLASVLTPAIITVVGNYPPESFIVAPPEEANRYMRYIYVKPWCRAGSWVVGIWTGYILFKYSQKKFSLKPWQVVTGWTVALFLATSSLFGMYSYSQVYDAMEYGVMTQFFYGGFHRAVWALALAWVVVACHTGNGGVVNSFLSYPGWQPLSRLTYSIYLMSIVVQLSIGLTKKSTIYVTHKEIIIETCGSLFVTAIAATIVSLSVESPILGLEKLLLGKPAEPTRRERENVDNPLTSRK